MCPTLTNFSLSLSLSQSFYWHIFCFLLFLHVFNFSSPHLRWEFKVLMNRQNATPFEYAILFLCFSSTTWLVGSQCGSHLLNFLQRYYKHAQNILNSLIWFIFLDFNYYYFLFENYFLLRFKKGKLGLFLFLRHKGDVWWKRRQANLFRFPICLRSLV